MQPGRSRLAEPADGRDESECPTADRDLELVAGSRAVLGLGSLEHRALHVLAKREMYRLRSGGRGAVQQAFLPWTRGAGHAPVR